MTVYAPVPKPKKKDVDPHAPKKTDSPEVAQCASGCRSQTIICGREKTIDSHLGRFGDYNRGDRVGVVLLAQIPATHSCVADHLHHCRRRHVFIAEAGDSAGLSARLGEA